MMVRRCVLIIAVSLVASISFAQSPNAQLVFLSSEETSFLRFYSISEGNREALWDSDPLSTGWMLSIDGVEHTPGAGEWIRTEEIVDDGRLLTYTFMAFTLEQHMIFAKDRRHVVVKMTFRNNSDRDVNFIPVLILDTILGDMSGMPFQYSNGKTIVAETEIRSPSFPQWIRSSRNSRKTALYLYLGGNFTSQPKRIIMANWLRLQENAFNYKTREGQSFDFFPLSENDSALLLEYGATQVESAGKKEIILLLGIDENIPNESDFIYVSEAVPEEQRDVVPEEQRDVVPEEQRDVVPEEQRDVVPEEQRDMSLQSDLLERIHRIDAVIEKVDNLLDGDEETTEFSVVDIKEQANEQERIQAEYENLQ